MGGVAVLWEDAFKMWTHQIRRKDGGMEPHVGNNESVPSATTSQPADCELTKVFAEEPRICQHWRQEEARLTDTSVNRVGSHYGATMALACAACPTGRQRKWGSRSAHSLQAQQACLLSLSVTTEDRVVCSSLELPWKHVITEKDRS